MGRLLSYFVELIFLILIAKMLGRALQGLFSPSPPRRENRAVDGGPRDAVSYTHLTLPTTPYV